jgi:hypothetical protein
MVTRRNLKRSGASKSLVVVTCPAFRRRVDDDYATKQ